jgi:hypothetical protein
VLLVLPGLLALLWVRHRRMTLLTFVCIGVTMSLAAAAAIDVYWFGRPTAAHLRHAVHMVQSALHLTQAPNPEIPSLVPFTLRDRYEAVVNYWLFGSTPNPMIYAFAAGLLSSFVLPRRFGVWGSALVIAAVCLAAAADTLEVLTAPKWLAGLFHLAPYITFVFLPGPAALRDSWPRLVLFTTASYLLIAFAGVDTSGGKSLGPRLLLPLLPLLASAAVIQIRGYVRGRSLVEVATGWMGAALCVLAIALHLGGTLRAYHGRNAEDGAAVLAVAAATERFVIADDPFTAQLLFPLYYRKIVLLADSSEAAEMLGRSLADSRMLGGALLISRELEPRVRLDPLRLHTARQVGRMTLQHWRR